MTLDKASLVHVDRVVREAAEELFAHYGIPLLPDRGDGPTASEGYVATIGYTHASLAGSLVLHLDQAVVMASLPDQLKHRTPVPGLGTDWAGELANQLLGRIKRKFFAFGMDLNISTPVVFKGLNLAWTPPWQGMERLHHWRWGDSPVRVSFQLRPRKDLVISPREATGDQGLAEGEVTFF